MTKLIIHNDIVFLRDTSMSREAFERLPLCAATNGAAVAEMARAIAGRTCRVKLDRDGVPSWHAVAWLSINGTERVTAARVKFGRYQSED